MNLDTKKNFNSNKNDIYCYGNKEGCRNIRHFVWMVMIAVATVVVVIVRMGHNKYGFWKGLIKYMNIFTIILSEVYLKMS